MSARNEQLANEVQAAQKELGKAVNAMNALQSQLTENNLVKQELDNLDDDATVLKLVGPVLISQDLDEAKTTVDTRIKFITKEVGNAKAKVEKLEKTLNERRAALIKT